MPKHYAYVSVVMPAVGRTKEKHFLARRTPGGRIMILAEFRGEGALDDVVRALEGGYAHALWEADLKQKMAAE